MLEKVLINTRDYIFAIPENNENLVLRNFLEEHSYHYFAGSEKDVLGRFNEASNLYKSTNIVRVCADNPFIDYVEIDRLIDLNGMMS